MKKVLLSLVVLSGCAGVGLRGESEAVVEVVGHVTNGCHVAGAQPQEQVTLRAAGELDAVATTQTDSTGAFSFVVPSDAKRKLYIEARGKKALATSRSDTTRKLVAELALPCRG